MNDYDGEKELVLGNKQLLTIFFVAALLCGVFFAMGYVVGGNSAKSAAATAANDTAPAPVAEGKRAEPPPVADTDSAPSPATGDEGSQIPGSEPKVADNPVAAGSSPPLASPLPAPAAASAPVVSSSKQDVAKPFAPAAPGSPIAEVFVSVPETGTSYWQVAAPTRPAADVLVKSLRDRGLPAILTRSSKPGLFEVLVGPYRTTITLADAKKRLTELGFDGLIVHKQP